jgi:hypothetical protein
MLTIFFKPGARFRRMNLNLVVNSFVSSKDLPMSTKLDRYVPGTRNRIGLLSSLAVTP